MYYAGILLVLPRNIIEPLPTLIVAVCYRQFPAFIQTKDKINHFRRQVQYKCADKAKRNGDAPHDNRIANQSKVGIAAGAENACDGQSIHGLPNHIVGTDKQHEIQIILR